MRVGLCWALAMYAIYGIPIYWRYTWKRVLALLVTQKSQKRRRGEFRGIDRRPKEDGSRRSGVGWEDGVVLGIVPPTAGLASWLGINKQLQLRRGGEARPQQLQLPSRQRQPPTLQLHLQLLHLHLLLQLLLPLLVLLISRLFSTSAPKKGGVTM